MQIELITKTEHIHKLKDEWNYLLAKNEVNEIFLTYEWAISWLESFWKEKELFFLVIREGDKLIGLAPLLVYEEKYWGLKIKSLGFVGKNSSDYNDFIVVGDKKKMILYEIFNFIILNKNKFDTIDLIQIPEYSSTLNFFRQYVQEKNIKSDILFKTICPMHILNETSEELFNKKNIRRAKKALSTIGEITFENLSESTKIKKYLSDFFNQHIKRREIVKTKSLFLQEESKRFYQSLIEILPASYILFSIVNLNKKPIAYHFGFVYNQKLIWYKPSFDIHYYKYSPGLILLKNLYTYAKDNNIREIDFTIGDEEFKTRFANKMQNNMRILMYNNFLIYFFDVYIKKFFKKILIICRLRKPSHVSTTIRTSA